VVFSPDGEAVALAKHDLVLVWRISDSTLVESYEVPEGTSQVAFSPDGSLLANGAGSVIQLWRRTDGELLQTLSGHSDVITGLAFSADGRFLVSGSWDGTVRSWGVPES
jgi:WD40 repeat protein